MIDERFKTLERVIRVQDAKIQQLDKLHGLLEEMTEITDNFILWCIHYCDEHGIPFAVEPQLSSYVKLSRHLLRELQNTALSLEDLNESRKLPLKKSARKSRRLTRTR